MHRIICLSNLCSCPVCAGMGHEERGNSSAEYNGRTCQNCRCLDLNSIKKRHVFVLALRETWRDCFLMSVPHFDTFIGKKCRIKGGCAYLEYGAENLCNGVRFSLKLLLFGSGVNKATSNSLWCDLRCNSFDLQSGNKPSVLKCIYIFRTVEGHKIYLFLYFRKQFFLWSVLEKINKPKRTKKATNLTCKINL